ncbi:MAG: hypothetical protein AB2541_04060 [Candidatus Thiodiazotropha sp.]
METPAISILTRNATGIMSSAAYLSDCLNHNKVDICGISEHWLYEKDLSFLYLIDNCYNSHAVSDWDLKRPSKRRVGKGGVAILWHRKHHNKISPLLFDDDRIVGIKFEINTDNFIFFFQLYLPCVNHSIELYKEYLNRLQNIISIYSELGTVILMGDINTHLTRCSQQEPRLNSRGAHFNDLLRENNLISINTLDFCVGAGSTFVTYDGRHESLIDHIILPVEKLQYVTFCEIRDDDALNVSRHRPVHCMVELPICCFDPDEDQIEYKKINWRKADEKSVNAYVSAIQNNERLQSNFLEGRLNSMSSIDQAYETLVNEITVAAQNCFPVKRFKHFLKPYWNRELDTLHKRMTQKRAAWVSDGRPRGPEFVSFKEYKNAKREFRRCHRKFANEYLQTQVDQIDQAAEVDSSLFWRLINARRKNSNSRPGSELLFDGRHCNTSMEINSEWADYFAKLYSPTRAAHFNNVFTEVVGNEMANIKRNLEISTESLNFPIISVEEVGSALNLMHRNKAGGDDGLMYEHLIYGGPFLHEILSKFFNAIVRFSYAPKAMKRGVIITIFKGGTKGRIIRITTGLSHYRLSL